MSARRASRCREGGDMSENVGLPMATAPFQTGVDKIVAARVSTIYESSDACPLVDWPYDGYYFAVDDETPTKVNPAPVLFCSPPP